MRTDINIIKTLAYFDIFKTPLTKEEIFKWSWQKEIDDYTKFLQDLNELIDKNIIESKDGYYYLPGTANNIQLRQRSIALVEEKMKIAVRAVKKISWVPFIQAIFVCNTVAGAGVKKNSDIDVFIVIKNGRLWISRFLITLTLSLFGVRRNKEHVANKICLSFFATDTALNFSDIKLEDTDIYLAYWLDNLIPVYDPHNIQNKIKKENTWTRELLPNAHVPYLSLPRWNVEDKGISKFVKFFFEKSWQGKYGHAIETQAKKIQKTKMRLNLTSAQNENNTDVIISDSMLKFHENDRRALYREKWENRYKEILTNYA